MALTPLRAVTASAPVLLTSPQALEDFEQELVDQYALALAAAGVSDGFIAASRSTVFEFARSLPGPIWTAGYADGDRFLAEQRRLGRAQTTRAGKAGAIAQFYDCLLYTSRCV